MELQHENESMMGFLGTLRETFADHVVPDFYSGESQVTLDAFLSPESMVPYRFAAGQDFVLENNGLDDICANFVFKLNGHVDLQESQMKLIGEFTHRLQFDWDKFHVAYRAVKDPINNAIRTFYYRVYITKPDQCTEHPEMLAGEPLGQYHCGVCGEMVCAAVPHAPLSAYADDIPTEAEHHFYRCLSVAESDFCYYDKLDGTDPEELPKPDEVSMKHAREFLEMIRPQMGEKHRVGHAMLDPDGIVGIYWPDNEFFGMYASIAFYEDGAAVYSCLNKDDLFRKTDIIVRDDSYTENLLAFVESTLEPLENPT